MSTTTFLLILAVAVLLFVGFLVRTWFDLSNVTRAKREPKPGEQDQSRGPDDRDRD